MRIDLSRSIPQPPDPQESTKSGSRATSRSSGNTPTDAHLPSDHSRVEALAAAVSELPDVRQDKVTVLAEMVHGGTYHVTPEQTAEALVSHLVTRPAASPGRNEWRPR